MKPYNFLLIIAFSFTLFQGNHLNNRSISETLIKIGESENEEVNIILCGLRNNLRVYGATKGKQWLSSGNTLKHIKSSTKFRIFDNKGYVGTFNKKSNFLQDKSCSCTNLKIGFKAEKEKYYTGITGDWDIYPNAVTEKRKDNIEYKNIVSDYLKSIKIEWSGVQLVNVIETDADNNGKKDIFIEAKGEIYPESGENTIGTFSVVLWNNNDSIISVKKNVYYNNNKTNVSETFKILKICDLDGDKRMEIILRTKKNTGDLEEVLSLDHKEFRPKISCVCSR